MLELLDVSEEEGKAARVFGVLDQMKWEGIGDGAKGFSKGRISAIPYIPVHATLKYKNNS